jgi:hypothetical protein
MNEIIILSDAFDSGELETLLKSEAQANSDLQFLLREETVNTMALDPTTLIALATIGSTVMTTIITGLFAVWQKKQDNNAKIAENKIKINTAIVKIKVAGGGELEIPYMIANDSQKLADLIKSIEAKPVKSIALITNP